MPVPDLLQLVQNFVQGPLIVGAFNAGGHRQDALGPDIIAGGVVAQGKLFPDVEKQLGIAGAAEQKVGQKHGGHIVGAAAEAHGELSLGHIHGLADDTGLGRGVHPAGRLRVPGRGPGQGGEGLQQGVLHPGDGSAAAVEQLQPGGRHHSLAVDMELLVVDGCGGSLVSQAADAVGLVPAHLLQKAQVRPVPLVVADGTDAVQQVGPLTVHILRQIPAVAGDGVQQQLSQQGGGGLQQLFPLGSEAVVHYRGHKADALALRPLADGRVDLCAVELVHGGGQLLDIRAAHGAPLEHQRQQRAVGRRLPPQGRDKLRRKAAGFELFGRQIGEIYPVHDLAAGLLHMRHLQDT